MSIVKAHLSSLLGCLCICDLYLAKFLECKLTLTLKCDLPSSEIDSKAQFQSISYILAVIHSLTPLKSTRQFTPKTEGSLRFYQSILKFYILSKYTFISSLSYWEEIQCLISLSMRIEHLKSQKTTVRRQIGHYLFENSAVYMQLMQKIWPHYTIVGQINICKHTGQVTQLILTEFIQNYSNLLTIALISLLLLFFSFIFFNILSRN